MQTLCHIFAIPFLFLYKTYLQLHVEIQMLEQELQHAQPQKDDDNGGQTLGFK